MEDANQVMSFGLAAVGIIYSAGLAADDATLSFSLLVVLGPTISILTLSLWCSAQERLARASHFLSGVEYRLKALAGSQVATWEEWLRQPEGDRPSHHLWAPETTAFLLTLSIAFGSIALGLLARAPLPVSIQLATAGVVLLFLAVSTRNMKRRFRHLRSLLSTSFGGV